MSVTYHYWRFHIQYDEQIDSLHEALARAKHDVEYQEASPDKIILEDGTVLEEEEIMERSGYYADVEITGPIIDSTLANGALVKWGKR